MAEIGAQKDWKAPHLTVGKGVLPPVVLVAGDPGRVDKIAAICDSFEEVAYNREYKTVVASFQGARFGIVSHGIGTAGAAICFEELVQCGAKTIVRLGTCGALQPHIGQGDLIVVTAACREDGTTKLMAPVEFPAVADTDIVNHLSATCDELEANSYKGIVLTSDLFYPSKLPSSLQLYADCGALGVEMEVACLLMVAQLRGIKAGAVATVDGNPLKWGDGDYDPHGNKVAEGKQKMLEVGIHLAAKLSKEGEQSSPKKRKVK